LLASLAPFFKHSAWAAQHEAFSVQQAAFASCWDACVILGSKPRTAIASVVANNANLVFINETPEVK